MTEKKVKFTAAISAVLDPEFCSDLVGMARDFDARQAAADESRWLIARDVNDQWDEHKTAFETKEFYYAECSRVLNTGCENKRKRWAGSGETLRRWCEVQESYSAFPNALEFLDALSFDHLYKARKLYNDGKIIAPVAALAKAVKERYTAGEMVAHYDPRTPYGVISKTLSEIEARQVWAWMGDEKKIETALEHVSALRGLLDGEK